MRSTAAAPFVTMLIHIQKKDRELFVVDAFLESDGLIVRGNPLVVKGI
jgi:hypothetical protein